MRHTLPLILVLAFLACPPARASEETAVAADWSRSVVTLDVKRKNYNFLQPWNTPMQNVQKFGVVTGPDEILTTAEDLNDTTLLRIQKEGRGRWYQGEVRWVDYHANLAVVTAGEETFWEDLVPVELADPIPVNGAFQIVRWRNGKLEVRRAELNQFTLEESPLSYAQFVHVEFNSEINAAGRAEPVVSDGRFAGFVIAQSGNSCRVLPSCFAAALVNARSGDSFRGLGWFDFIWQPAENPDLLKYLKFEDKQQGVVIAAVPKHGPTREVLKRNDIILEIGGHEIDNTGDYRDPVYGHLSLENLATRKRWAGDTVPMVVWRDGREVEVAYQIPKVDYHARLIPHATLDQAPEYLVVGGLVFQPLCNSYLRSWGNDWRRRSPFRLSYFNNEEKTEERPSIVILSQVLPDPVNLGYQEQRNLVLERVNEHPVATLTDLRRALERPQGEFHVFQFMESSTLRRIVLDVREQEESAQRILTRYGISRPYYIRGADVEVARRGGVESLNR